MKQSDLFSKPVRAQVEGDLLKGRRLRDEGMRSTEGNQTEEWRDTARSLAERFLDSLPTHGEFSGESLRLHCKARGLGNPNHPNAWGAVIGGLIRRWRREEVVAVVGFTQAHDPKGHACSMPRYRKLRSRGG